MARTWSYRKRDIIINEVKPTGVPPVVFAYFFLSTAIMGIVLVSAYYFTTHPFKDAVIMGPKSESYQTVTPVPSSSNAPAEPPTSNNYDGPTVIDVH